MFDPYHKWLGIPPAEQPPDHYRLLGLARFEADREVIDAAANRQMAYLQGCATGERAALSERLLNEVAAARLELLTPARKAAYDARLRLQAERIAAVESGGRPAAAPEEAIDHTPPPPARPTRRARPDVLAPAAATGDVLAAGPESGLGISLDRATMRRRDSRMLAIFATISLALVLIGLLLGLRLSRPGVPDELVVPKVVEAAPPGPGPTPAPVATAGEAEAVPVAPVTARSEPQSPVEWVPPRLPSFPEESYRPIFFGRDVDRPLEEMSNCWQEEEYGDFALKFQYRLRLHDKQVATGVRLRHDDGGPLFSLVLSEGICGGFLLNRAYPGIRPPLVEQPLDPPNRLILPARDASGPFGSWNECEVVCQGARTVVAINGVVVNELADGPTGRGMICLAGYAEGAAFRAVRVANLDRPAPAPVAPRERPAAAPPIAAERHVVREPAILRWQASDWSGSAADFARHADGTVRVGMGTQDYGYGEVGLEATGFARIKIDVATAGTFRSLNGDSAAGFVIDYHTPAGYTTRQFCGFGLGTNHRIVERTGYNPYWGKGKPPNGNELIRLAKEIDLDLRRWAPVGWDGRVWFTVLLQNTGKNTSMTVKVRPIE